MNTLHEARTAKGLSLEKLSNLTGITPTNIHFLEHGKQFPNSKTRERLEKVLGRLDWFSTTGVKLRSGSYQECEDLLHKLLGIWVTLSSKEKSEFSKLVLKYFKSVK